MVVMAYTIDMLCDDHDHLIPILQAVEGIMIPENEWPKINIEGTVYSLNPHFPQVDTVRYFIRKYGKDRGTDYAWRFLEIIGFIDKYKENLIRDGMLKPSGSRSDVAEEILKVILDSFIPPQSPVIFPTSNLYSTFGVFDYNKVLTVAKSIMEE
jgi:hypothetical protein